MIKIGFIGYGKMAEYMTNSLNDKTKYEINVYDVNLTRIQVAKDKGYKISNSIEEVLKSKIVFLAIKPQNLAEIPNFTLSSDVTVISMLAGVEISKIQSKFINAKVVRIMPNLPISQKLGVIAVHSKTEINPTVFEILNSFGKTVTIDEDKFDEFTAISGSAPAYIFEFMKIYQDTCEKYGFENAKDIVIGNMRGAIAMYENSNKTLDTLVDSVCSKGGTTIEAISHFRKKKMDKILMDGIDNCRKRSQELNKV